MTRIPRNPIFGAVPGADGVRFRLWAPSASRVELHRRPPSGGQVCVSTLRGASAPDEDGGMWEFVDPDAKAGDRYAFSIDGRELRPDPAGRFLPDGVHGWSEVIDPRAFTWTDAAWTGIAPAGAVLYELHLGTFTREGTFRAAIGKLPYLRDLGITAIELMPVADFAGRRNWGYDGVAPFAPAHAYGRPDDLRALVDAAHAAGLAVIMDVVYNHFGPEGAYIGEISPAFLTDKHATPWGGAVNLDDAGSGAVRAFIIDNALHWIDEYHVDGLRLDATHSLFDSGNRHFVAELVAAVHATATPPPLVYAEDHRNLALMLEPPDCGGWDLDGVWADDFHHVVRRMLAGDQHGYYEDFDGTACELARTLRDGWLFTGQHSRHENAPRGTDPSAVPLRKAVICVQNHDQVGNRALGDRLHHNVDPAAWRAAVAVLLAAPMTPLLFMGQEWATSAPFQFFTDFEPGLGRLVVEGRRREFKAFPEFASPEGAERVPDPQAEITFHNSRLQWDEQDSGDHAGSLALHRALLRLRQEHADLRPGEDVTCRAEAIGEDTVMFGRGTSTIVVARLRGSGVVEVPAIVHTPERLLDTEDPRFSGDPRRPCIDYQRGTIEFQRPGAVILTASVRQ